MKKKMTSIFAVLTIMMALTPTLPASEAHPEIQRALGALRNARAHLQDAAHDFGGHRADALRATDEAIHQLQICLKYDKN